MSTLSTSREQRQRASEWAKANPERRREIQKKYQLSEKYEVARRNREYIRKYGITLDEYNSKLMQQKCVCAICGKQEKSKSLSNTKEIKHLAVDHDHATGKIRGLLCDSCNTLLGRCSDNIQILESAINYLREYS